jgi:hypothetical protein
MKKTNYHCLLHLMWYFFKYQQIIRDILCAPTNIAIFFFFFFGWNAHLYVSVHPQLVIQVFYCFSTYLQEIGLKGKKGKLNNYSSHFWLCASPLTALSGIYEYCIPVLYCTFLYLYGGQYRKQ